jgi:hypothetical protein
MERLVKEALKGNVAHIREVLDRVEGKAIDRIEVAAPPALYNVIKVEVAAGATEQARQARIDEAVAQIPPGGKTVIGDAWLDV